MNKNSKDILLGILCGTGVFYIIESLYWLIYNYLLSDIIEHLFASQTFIPYKFIKITLFFDFVIALFFSVLVYKKLKISKYFSRYYIISFIVFFIIEVIFRLLLFFKIT